jgi:hypothetical protein
MEDFRCLDCEYVGALENGRCKCGSEAVISEEVVKIYDYGQKGE